MMIIKLFSKCKNRTKLKLFLPKSNNEEEFFIRASASSQPLNIRETHEYIQSHWK